MRHSCGTQGALTKVIYVNAVCVFGMRWSFRHRKGHILRALVLSGVVSCVSTCLSYLVERSLCARVNVSSKALLIASSASRYIDIICRRNLCFMRFLGGLPFLKLKILKKRRSRANETFLQSSLILIFEDQGVQHCDPMSSGH